MTNEKIQDITAQVKAAQALFEQTVAGVAPEAFHRAPREGEWSPAQVVAHVNESSIFLVGNAIRMSTEDNPFIGRDEAGMQARDQAIALHSQDSPVEALRLVREANSLVLGMVERLTDADLARTGQHPRLGAPTVERILEMVVNHLGDHIWQIKECTGG
jgi:hypothetical protein